MRVVHVSPRSFDHPRAGGGERYPFELVAALEGLQVDVSLQSWPNPPRRFKSVMRWAVRFLRDVWKADLIHIHQLNSWTGDISILLSVVLQKPVVLTDHGGGWRSPGRVLGRYRYRFIQGLAAVSKWSAEVDLQWPAGLPSVVVYGGSAVEAVLPAAAEQPRRGYLYVGRIVPHKALDVVVSALPERSFLRVVGRAPSADYLNSVVQIADSRDISLEVLVGASDAELASAYARAEYLLVPTRSSLDGVQLKRPELLGLVVVEAFAMGLPVIGSDAGALPEILNRAGMPIFEAGSIQSLREVISSAPAGGSPEWLELQRSARRGAKDLSWKKCAESCIALYRVVVSKKRTGHSVT